MIEYTWQLLQEFFDFAGERFAWRDAVDIVLVTFAIYWLLLLIRGTRAVQILVGVIVLIALSLASQFFQLATTRWILDTFMGSIVLIIVVLFQNDIRRALARVGRFGFFLSPEQEESAIVEEVVRAARWFGRSVVTSRATAMPYLAMIYAKNNCFSLKLQGAPLAF